MQLDHIRLVSYIHPDFAVLVALYVLHARRTPGFSSIRFYIIVKMRLAAVTVVLAAGAIARAQLSNIPQCSVCPVHSMSRLNVSFLTNPCSFFLQLNCFTSALGGDGCSELTDFACHCQKPGLVDEIVPCINKACDIADQQGMRKPHPFRVTQSNQAL